MIIDHETFRELTLHVRRASDGLLSAAREIADACDGEPGPEEEQTLGQALDSLVASNNEFVVVERILRVVWQENREDLEPRTS